MMMELKERIHKRAIDNIHKAQEKYKHYYDEKHNDPEVINNCFPQCCNSFPYTGVYGGYPSSLKEQSQGYKER